MNDSVQALRVKQQELARVKKEVEALRIVAKLLTEDDVPAGAKAAAAGSGAPEPNAR
jgi:hypothetical protein